MREDVLSGLGPNPVAQWRSGVALETKVPGSNPGRIPKRKQMAGNYSLTQIGGGWQTEKSDKLFSIVRNLGTNTYTVCRKVTKSWKKVVADCESEEIAKIVLRYLEGTE